MLHVWAPVLFFFFLYVCRMESLNVEEKHVIRMLGYTPFPKKIKYMIHSPLSLVGSLKSILVFKKVKKKKIQNQNDFQSG